MDGASGGVNGNQPAQQLAPEIPFPIMIFSQILSQNAAMSSLSNWERSVKESFIKQSCYMSVKNTKASVGRIACAKGN